MKTLSLYTLVLALVIIVSGCSTTTTEPTNTTPAYIKLGTATASGTTIELYADDSLVSGYNTMYVKVLDAYSKAIVRDAHIQLIPIMDMGMMKHSCPTEQPTQTVITGDYFRTAAVFQMSTIPNGTWKIKVEFHNHVSDKEDQVEIPVTVGESNCCKPIKCTDNNTYVVAIANHMEMITGVNNIEFTVHRKIDDMTYEPATNISMEMTPEMPSMGHGSPNNADPVHVANGHYKGKANFTMTGEWRITATLKLGDTSIGSTQLYLTIKK